MSTPIKNIVIYSIGSVTLCAALQINEQIVWDGSRYDFTSVTYGQSWSWDQTYQRLSIVYPNYNPPKLAGASKATPNFHFGVKVVAGVTPFTWDTSNRWSYDPTTDSIATYKFSGTTLRPVFTYTGIIDDTRNIGSILLKNSGLVELWPKFCQDSGRPLVRSPFSGKESQWKVDEGGQVIIGPDQRQGWPATSGAVNLGVEIRWSQLDPQDTSRGWNLSPEFIARATYEWKGAVVTGKLNYNGITN